MDRQYKLLDSIQKFADKANAALDSGVTMQDIIKLESKDELGKARFEEDFEGALEKVIKKMDDEFDSLKSEDYAVTPTAKEAEQID